MTRVTHEHILSFEHEPEVRWELTTEGRTVPVLRAYEGRRDDGQLCLTAYMRRDQLASLCRATGGADAADLLLTALDWIAENFAGESWPVELDQLKDAYCALMGFGEADAYQKHLLIEKALVGLSAASAKVTPMRLAASSNMDDAS